MIKGSYPLPEFTGRKTPFYFYDMGLLQRTLDKIVGILADTPQYKVHYAVKANFNPAILKTIAAAGFGADCVSGGEIEASLAAGFPAQDIFFAGVGKSDWEIQLALDNRIGRFNVESLPELEVIDSLAGARGVKAPVSLRVNPDIGAHTHAKITTGLSENKFGINYTMLEEILSTIDKYKNIEYKGLHFHIGSQILDMADFAALSRRINSLVGQLVNCGLPVGDINVGGGLGIIYEHPNHHDTADFETYFSTFRDNLKVSGTVHFELGRSIVAPCGTLISRVLYVKKGESRQFAVIDAGMTELIRPALYGAYHRIENISSDGDEQLYDVVGPVCESSDVFLESTVLDKCHRGDYIAIRSVGAYGESMSCHYNCRQAGETFYFE